MMEISNDETRDLCLALIHADTEDAIISILADKDLWDDSRYWRNYGDYENNFNTIGNQQSRPEAALVEKLVNSVDARLMGKCLESDISPEGSDAPKSIKHAVAHFFDTGSDPTSSTAGLVSMWPDSLRAKTAKGITLSATGHTPGEGYPCFTISDCGEGQTPEMMPSTFLSLTKSNKLRIPFVQGKFNMGGTGVLQFCGKHNIQLVVSKRNPKILDGSDAHESDGYWGFTIVRRDNPIGGRRNSVYTYLAPVGSNVKPGQGRVLRFIADSLPIFPEGNQPYVRTSEWGSLIKLYEYDVTGFKTHILRKGGLLGRLDLLLPNLALPIRLHECRAGYKGHKGSFDTSLTGVGVRLEDDKAENLEFEPNSSPIRVMGERMTATIYAFKKGKAETYRRNEGVVFTVNGQTHGYFTTDFFRRKKVGMSYLADSILVIVDCSKITGRAREDLFMNSRDRLRGGDLRAEIEKALENLLRSHEGLRELKESRRRDEIESRIADNKALEEILEELLKSSPALANFLLEGISLPNPFKTKTAIEKEEEYQGKKYPTYFKFRDVDHGETLLKECHINRRARVPFDTDAANDYFSREVVPGEFNLFYCSNGSKHLVEDYVLNLYEGNATLNLQLPPNCQVEDTLEFLAEVTDDTQVETFVNRFKVYVKDITKTTGGGNGTKEKRGKKSDGEEEGEGRLALPKIIRVTEEEWENQQPTFDEYTGLRIIHAGTDNENGKERSVYDFYVNVDNFFLKTAMKEVGREPKLTEAKFIYGLTLLGLALLKQDADAETSSNGASKSNDDEGLMIEEKVEILTSAAAMVMLLMIDELSELDIEEANLFIGDGEST